MKKIFWLIPLGLILISIIFSVFSFNLTNEIKKGYILLTEEEISPYYSGNYNIILGNVNEKINYTKLTNNADSITLDFYDKDFLLIESILLSIENTSATLSNATFSNLLSSDYIDLKINYENIFTVSLDNSSTYELKINYITDDPNIDQLDYAVYYLDEAMYNQQSIYSNVMVTSFIFFVLSIITLGGYYIVKKL